VIILITEHLYTGSPGGYFVSFPQFENKKFMGYLPNLKWGVFG
jgi:hypothetical protein